MHHIKAHFSKPAFWFFLLTITASFFLQNKIRPTYAVEEILLKVKKNAAGQSYYETDDKTQIIRQTLPFQKSSLHPDVLARINETQGEAPLVKKEVVYKEGHYYELHLKRHYGIYSLLPAITAIGFCWLSHEPLVSLFLASLSGAVLLGDFNYIDDVLLPAFSSKNAALILVLYLWLLGGLLGLWAKTGAALAFANWLSLHFVRGPRTARLAAWALGVLFFQGGTISTVLVGTTIKPAADKQKISHEELSYIVDSTASPIACLLAFNAWPVYIQAFLYLPGVAFLASEKDRIAFFFESLPLSFYSILAVLGTFLFCFDKLPFIGQRMRSARTRARSEGKLDAPGASPLSAKELHEPQIPLGYKPHFLEFALPLLLLLGTVIGTFISSGSPDVYLGFGIALAFLMGSALIRGMQLKDLVKGLGDGWKGTVSGALILLFALTLGQITKETGGGLYLAKTLEGGLPYWLLPAALFILTVTIAFSTGTSWGTYAVVYPLAMPLAWSMGADLSHPELFLSICFAVVLNGSVIGDQSSPISDTTILSSMCTGCDLMDHVRTQIVPVFWGALLACLLWTALSFVCA